MMTTKDMTPTNAARNPVVFERGGEVFANSRDVAAFFGKRHDNVLRDIDGLIAHASNLRDRQFTAVLTDHPTIAGRKDRSFDMDRDGFTLLAMGFTGAKALKWKLRYIEAFNALEAEVRRIAESGPAIDLNDPGALRGLLLTYSEKAIALQSKVDELMPSKEALERIAEADGSLCITDAAKALQMMPKALFEWLSRHGWIYRRIGSTAWLGYEDKRRGGYLEHKVTTVQRPDGTERVFEQVRVTAKGLTKLAGLIEPPLQAA